LLTDIKAGVVDVEGVRIMRDKLQSDLHKLYKGSPRTLSKAYDKASTALKKMDEMTFSEEEIDKFLPKTLRKADGQSLYN
jgi:hypothetical protein